MNINWTSPNLQDAYQEIYYLHSEISKNDFSEIIQASKRVLTLSPHQGLDLIRSDDGSDASEILRTGQSLTQISLDYPRIGSILQGTKENTPICAPLVDLNQDEEIVGTIDGRHRILTAALLGVPRLGLTGSRQQSKV